MFFTSSLRWRVSALAILLCLTVLPLSAAQKKHVRKPSPAKQAAPPDPQPPPTPVELTLAQKPAVPPQVTYEHGQLTIIAENSTIGDVLRAVRNQTGATVEIPPNATQRIVSRVGPGPAREVLVSLLNGSDFNYVLMGAAGDPSAVQKIIVTPKPAGGSGTMQASAPPPPNGIPPQVYEGVPPQASEAGSDVDSESESESGNEEAEQPEPVPGRPAAPPGVKTPEQMLQELQQQQQILQQQQQQQQQQGQPEPQN